MSMCARVCVYMCVRFCVCVFALLLQDLVQGSFPNYSAGQK